jgi:hypothetical protein
MIIGVDGTWHARPQQADATGTVNASKLTGISLMRARYTETTGVRDRT